MSSFSLEVESVVTATTTTSSITATTTVPFRRDARDALDTIVCGYEVVQSGRWSGRGRHFAVVTFITLGVADSVTKVLERNGGHVAVATHCAWFCEARR